MPKQNLPNVYEDTLTAKIDRELGGQKGMVQTQDLSGNSLGTTMVSQGYKKNIKLTSRAVEITVSIEMYNKQMPLNAKIRINGRYQKNYRVTIKGQFSVNDEIIPETYTSVKCVDVDNCYQAYGKNKHGNFTLLLYRKKPTTTKKQPTLWFMSKTYTSFKQASSATKKKYQSPKAWYREHERTVDLITSENEKRNRKNQKKRVLFKPEESVRTPRRRKKKKVQERQPQQKNNEERKPVVQEKEENTGKEKNDQETDVQVRYDVGFLERTEHWTRALTRSAIEESTYFPKESRGYKMSKQNAKHVNAITEYNAKEKLKELGKNFKLVLIKTMTSKTIEPFVPAEAQNTGKLRFIQL